MLLWVSSDATPGGSARQTDQGDEGGRSPAFFFVPRMGEHAVVGGSWSSNERAPQNPFGCRTARLERHPAWEAPASGSNRGRIHRLIHADAGETGGGIATR